MWLLTAALLFSLLGEYFANYHMGWCNNLCIQQVSVKATEDREPFVLLVSLPWLTSCRLANCKTTLVNCTDCWVWFELFVFHENLCFETSFLLTVNRAKGCILLCKQPHFKSLLNTKSLFSFHLTSSLYYSIYLSLWMMKTWPLSWSWYSTSSHWLQGVQGVL